MIDEKTWPELLQKLGSQRAVARYLGIEEYQLRRLVAIPLRGFLFATRLRLRP